jgi:integrase/recombinase XerD
MPKLTKGQAAVLMPDELKRLLRVISTTNYAKRDTLLILMSFGLGLRVLELAALKISDVLNDNAKVKEVISLTKTKLLKQRNAYISDPRIKKAIIDYIEERKEHAAKKRLTFSLCHPLFLSKKGSHFTNKTLQKRFEHLYKMAGIEKASSHSGRRTFATNLIQQGVDIKSVCTLMGHANINMTALYVQDNPIRLKRIAAKALY